jgi:hypothetical protein
MQKKSAIAKKHDTDRKSRTGSITQQASAFSPVDLTATTMPSIFGLFRAVPFGLIFRWDAAIIMHNFGLAGPVGIESLYCVDGSHRKSIYPLAGAKSGR